MNDPIQEQLIAARQNQILNAAAKVFAAKGFHPTTIKDIASEAGIAYGTIYTYFESKTALLLGILARMREAALHQQPVDALKDADFHTFISVYVRQPLIALRGDNFELFRVVVSEVLVNQELRDRYYRQILEPTIALAEEQFQQWVEQGVIRPIDISLTMRAISAMMMGLMLENIIGDPTLQAKWDELPDFLTDLILNGIASSQP